MIRDPKFDDIRPYYSEEIPQAMERIAGSEFFPLLASYVFPGEDVAAVGRMVGSIGTSEDFQRMVMLPMCGPPPDNFPHTRYCQAHHLRQADKAWCP
mgnify:CR=1 FL=1